MTGGDEGGVADAGSPGGKGEGVDNFIQRFYPRPGCAGVVVKNRVFILFKFQFDVKFIPYKQPLWSNYGRIMDRFINDTIGLRAIMEIMDTTPPFPGLADDVKK